MVQYHDLGVALIPTAEHQERIYRSVGDLNRLLDFVFCPAPDTSIPHLSLFQGRYRNEKDVVSIIDSMNFSDVSQTQRISGFSFWAEDIFFMDIKRSEDLYRTHNRVFNELFPLVKISRRPQKISGITEGQRKSLKETGYPFSLKEFYPHITLAKVKEESKKYLESLLPLSDFAKIVFDRVIVFRVGDFGACKDVVYEKLLK